MELINKTYLKEFILGVIRKERSEIEGNEEMVNKSTERCNAMRQEITAANTQFVHLIVLKI